MKYYFILFQCLIVSSISFASDNHQQRPNLILANIYKLDTRLQDYWVSEKFDGVRAYWNGKELVSRQGNIFHAPKWFIASLPGNTTLDGELWLGRGKFEVLSGIVRRQSTVDSDWNNIKYMVFDLPEHHQAFDERLKKLEKVILAINVPHIKMVQQHKVISHQVLMKELDDIVKQGGEGLMLHLGSSIYASGRSDDLLKVKKYFDAEAVVIKHIPGKGKYKGMLGSLEVETVDKKIFKIGTGFSDFERKNPPVIGSLITYKYFGLTSKGIPRFASFVRIRNTH